MTNQHTPGPWKATDDAKHGCCFGFHVETEERDPNQGQYAKEGIADVLKEADARLIAAAPDLKAALQGLRDVIHDYLTHEQQLAVKDYIHAADAAIAKASPERVPTLDTAALMKTIQPKKTS